MRIGIPVQNLGETVGVRTDYLTLVEEVGHTPVLIYPKNGSEVPKIGGLLLPGGTDVDSKRYQPLLPRIWCYPPDPYLEYFDTQILPHFISPDVPIFGICRGLQTLNVHFGGSLYRDIWKHPYSKEKSDLVHEVIGQVSGRVNSFHHQAIWKLGNGLEWLEKSDDGFIEAIRHEELPIYAVQWHPERMDDGWSRGIMKRIFGG